MARSTRLNDFVRTILMAYDEWPASSSKDVDRLEQHSGPARRMMFRRDIGVGAPHYPKPSELISIIASPCPFGSRRNQFKRCQESAYHSDDHSYFYMF